MKASHILLHPPSFPQPTQSKGAKEKCLDDGRQEAVHTPIPRVIPTDTCTRPNRRASTHTSTATAKVK